MKNKKMVIIIASVAILTIGTLCIMALIGKTGAGSSVAAATQYIEASMRYDAHAMASVASDKQRQQLYNTGEIPTVKQLTEALNKSYKDAVSGYEGKSITFTVSESRESGNTGYVKLNVYVDGEKKFTRECYTVCEGGRWYYDLWEEKE